MEQELKLGKVNANSDNLKNDWRSVLEFQDWTALHTLKLSNAVITQIIVTLMTLELNWWAACPGPTLDV